MGLFDWVECDDMNEDRDDVQEMPSGDAAGEAPASMSREPEVAMSDLQTSANAEAQGQETESLQCSGVTFRKLRCTRSGWFPWGGLRYCGMHIPKGVPYQMIEIARSPEMSQK